MEKEYRYTHSRFDLEDFLSIEVLHPLVLHLHQKWLLPENYSFQTFHNTESRFDYSRFETEK